MDIHFFRCNSAGHCAPGRSIGGGIQLPQQYADGIHKDCMIKKNEWPAVLPCLRRIPPLDYSPISAPQLEQLLACLITRK